MVTKNEVSRTPTRLLYSESYTLDQVSNDHRHEVEFQSTNSTDMVEKQNIQIIIDRLNKSNQSDKISIETIIGKYTVININDINRKFMCPKGMSIRNIVEKHKKHKHKHKHKHKLF
jgi:hypothetical protein